MHSLLSCAVAVAMTSPGLAPVPADGNADVKVMVARLVERLKQRPPAKPPQAGEKALYLLDIEKSGTALILSAADPEWRRTYMGSVSWSADGGRILFEATPGFNQWSRTR